MATAKKSITTKKQQSKKTDYSSMTLNDLLKKATELKLEAVELKRNSHMGDVQNVHAYSLKRREIARVLTSINATKHKKEEK